MVNQTGIRQRSSNQRCGIHETYWRPLPIEPPSPNRTSRRNTGNTLFLSRPTTIPIRMAILRVCGVFALFNVPSQACATSTEKASLACRPPLRFRRIHPMDFRTSVFINSRRAGVEPDRRRTSALANRLADDASGVDSRLQDFLPIGGVVAAIHRLARQIDDSGCAVQFRAPGSKRAAVPLRFTNGAIGILDSGERVKMNNVPTGVEKVPCKRPSEKSRAAR